MANPDIGRLIDEARAYAALAAEHLQLESRYIIHYLFPNVADIERCQLVGLCEAAWLARRGTERALDEVARLRDNIEGDFSARLTPTQAALLDSWLFNPDKAAPEWFNLGTGVWDENVWQTRKRRRVRRVTIDCKLVFADGKHAGGRVIAETPESQYPVEYYGEVERLTDRFEKTDTALLRCYFQHKAEELGAKLVITERGQYDRWAI